MNNRKKKNCSINKTNETYHARHVYGGKNYGVKECKKCIKKEMKNSSETNNETFYGGRRSNFLASNIPISVYSPKGSFYNPYNSSYIYPISNCINKTNNYTNNNNYTDNNNYTNNNKNDDELIREKLENEENINYIHNLIKNIIIITNLIIILSIIIIYIF